MKCIQEIFAEDFRFANTALVQRMRPSEHNMDALERGFTEHWPTVGEVFDLMVLSVGEQNDSQREIFVGFIEVIQPSKPDPSWPYFRIYVDRFQCLGVHDRSEVSDANFYNNGGGGGSRVKVYKTRPMKSGTKRLPEKNAPAPEGAMEQRLVWVRKNHARFRDPVWRYWDGRCAVSDVAGTDCAGLLVASHIYPWARSEPKEKTDVNNGLLLSAPLDKLFDKGLISFSDRGKMLVKNDLPLRTRELFGLHAAGPGIASPQKITEGMREYLARHRDLYKFKKTR